MLSHNPDYISAQRSDIALFDDAPVACFVMDGEGLLLRTNAAFRTLTALEDGVHFSALLAEPSRPRLESLLTDLGESPEGTRREELIFLAAGRSIPMELHFTFFRAEGTVRAWATATPLDGTGTLSGTAMVTAAQELRIAEQLSDILFEYDIDQNHLHLTFRYRTATWRQAELSPFLDGDGMWNQIHPGDRTVFRTLLDSVTDGRRQVRARLRIQRGTGYYPWYDVSGTVLYEDDRPQRLVGAATNVDQMVRDGETLLRATQVDPLTKVLNRVTVWSRIDAYLQGEGREGEHALFVLDMDDFQAVNRSRGELAGNLILAGAAERLVHCTDGDDLVGRMGGDAFVLLLKNRSALESWAAATELCRQVDNVGQGGGGAVTCSLGGSRYPDDGCTFRALYQKADWALNSAKRAGKNGFRLYANVTPVTKESTRLSLRYHNFDPLASLHEANPHLVANSLTLLFSGRDPDSTVSLILSILGDYYQVNHACIMEENPDEDGWSMTYEWSRDPNDRRLTPMAHFTGETMGRYVKFFDRDGSYCCHDVGALQHISDEMHEKLRGIGLRAVLQCAFLGEGRVRGFLSLEDLSNSRVWSREDVGSLILITRALGAQLIRYRVQQRNEHKANMDLLVDVWNFNKFVYEATAAMRSSRGISFATVTLDIKRFRYINDRLGYSEGNALLAAFGRVLTRCLGDGEMVMRINSDHFGLLLRYTELDIFRRRMESILKRASNPMLADGRVMKINVAAGIYLVNDTSHPISECLDRANLARSKAKISHRSKAVYYDRAMEQAALQEKFIEDNMERALAAGEFFVVYQPKVNIGTGQVAGAEALVRWKSPQKGILYPDTFIPVLEKTGFVVESDFFLLNQVCQKLRVWSEIYPGLVLAVNFSRVHVEHPESLSRALDIIRRWGIAPGQLEIEITESAFLDDQVDLSDYVVQLRRAGFRVAMDDFGSGYSSLAVLKDLPMDVLKLDREFLINREATDRERVVLSSVVDMAHELGMSVVAEGVEQNEQAKMLRRIGCELVQGYFYAAPMEADDFQRLLESGGTLAAWTDEDETVCTTN